MRFLIISDLYYPSKRSGAILIKDLINELIKKKKKITLLTTSFKKGQKLYEKKNNFEIYRTPKINLHGNNYIFKGLGQILAFIYLLFVAIFFVKKIDKIFIYSPPMAFGLFSVFLKKKKIVNIQDFFPQNAIDLGILKNKLIITILKKIEKIVYNYSDFLLVNSLNSKKYLINKFPQIKDKVIFNYNWVKLNKFKQKKYNKNKIFKFIFGGSLGPSQDLKKVFNVIKYLNKNCELHIYGNGISKKGLQKEILINNIKNIKIYDPIPNSKFIKKLQEYDSALLTLSSNNRTPFIPGKFNFYCSQRKNTTAIVHKECDLNYIIKKERLGFVTSQKNEKNLIHFFRKVIKSKNIKKFNLNAFNYAKKNFDVKYIVNKLEKI